MRLNPVFCAAGLVVAPLLVLAIAPTRAEAPAEVQEAINKGVIAAKAQDYPLAIRYFQAARKIAPDEPDIFFDLGLAESKIPGRELRAIAWFGAYLSANPAAPNAAAIRSQIDVLDVKGQSNLSRLIKVLEGVASQLPTDGLNSNLGRVAELWSQSGDFAAAIKIAKDIPKTKSDSLPYMLPSMFAEQVNHNYYLALYLIANSQAEAGDIAGAQKTADLIPLSPQKISALIAVAKAQTKAGAGAEAKRTLAIAFRTSAQIKDASDKSTALGNVAYAQLADGDIAGAQSTAAQLSDKIYLPGVQAGIAKAQVKAGNIDGALVMAEKISDPVDKRRAQIAVAEAQVKSGDLTGVRKTLAVIMGESNASVKSRFQKDVAELQLKAGDFAGALNAADGIPSADDKCQAQLDVAEAQTKAGDRGAALKTVAVAAATADRIQDPLSRSFKQGSVARAQLRAGDIDAALRSLDVALKTADQIQSVHRSNAQSSIVGMKVDAGDMAGAQRIVDQIQDAYQKGQAQSSVAFGQLKNGDLAGARITLDQIQDGGTKSYIQSAIADRLAKSGDISSAQKILASALDATVQIGNAQERSATQNYIAEAQRRIGSTNDPNFNAGISAATRDTVRQIVANWLTMLDAAEGNYPLNSAPFLDLSGFLKELPPTDDRQKRFSELYDIAVKIVDAQNAIDKMLKQQAKP